MNKIISIDIDGILNNYPNCWLDFIELEKNKRFQSITEAKKELGEQTYADVKHKYRTSGYKSLLPVNPIAPDFTKKLKERGYYIIIATSRPFHLYHELHDLTFNWLKSNNITFDRLEKKNEELASNFSLDFHIDDELEHVEKFLKKNIRVFIVKRPDIDYSNGKSFSTLTFVNNLEDILELI